MRLASYSHLGKDGVGFAHGDDWITDLAAAAHAAGYPASPWFSDMLALVAGGDAAIGMVRSIAAFAVREPESVPRIAQSEIVWHPPVRKPGKIIGVAINNNAADDRKISAPKHPLIFLKPTTSLIGHKHAIEVRPSYHRLHPEPELALIVSKRVRDLDPREALDYVFGWTILNDITGNDMRGEDRVHYYALYPSKDDPDKVERVEQHLSYTARYKGTDGFGPTGPFIVTKDEIADPHNLDVSCSIGGDILTEDNTRHYTYSYGEVMAWVSRFMTLEPGDMISLGTAFRAAKTGGRPLHAGDLSRLDGPVDVTIRGIGTLSNGIRRVTTNDIPDWLLNR
jgi:2-keto-4-pentenoate hydratase/2-oxohepta-3-ene-1,7-dioic acid hydratase in catechol pathway